MDFKGGGEVVDRTAVIEACEATLDELSATSIESQRCVLIAESDAVVIDAIGRYVDAAGTVSVVSSCDFYAFHDGRIASIISYALELRPVNRAADL